MKKIITLMAMAVFAIGAQAQQKTEGGSSVATYSSDQVQALSATLKESYGLLSREAAHLNREIGADAAKATDEQNAMKARMEKTLGQLESMLSTVNDASAATQWAEVKAKAEMVQGSATAILEERKSKR
ncbi:MAG TPA: hypothetical protein PKY96_06880 [Flavobacteriales bacterium]|nr:hypothetical protein [Flavobacteriales bacterium]